MRRSNPWWAVGVILLALCVANPAASEEDDKSVNEKILDILLERGDITPERYEELREEALEEQRAAAGRPGDPDAAPDPMGWKAYWKDGTRVERNDGQIKLKIGGRIQFDGSVVGADQAVSDLSDDPDLDFDDPEGTGLDFRRARLFVSGSFWDHGFFKAQYDFAGQDADFKDVYVGLRKIPWVGEITFGHQFEPFSIGQQTSSKYITFMSRSLTVLTFTAERNSGVKLANTALDDRMTWSVGGFLQTDDDGEAFSNQGDYNVSGRITGLPVWEDEGRRLVHLGASYRHEFGHDRVRNFGPRPETNTVDPIDLTGDLLVDGVDVVGLEFATVCGPFSFESEFADAYVNQSDDPSVNFWGVSGQVSWFLTGEHREYDREIGAFGRTAPSEPFSLEAGTWGAFEIAARASYLDLSDGDVRGAIVSGYTLGANWYLYRNLRFMLNGNWLRLNGVGDVAVAQARVSLDF